MWLWPISAMDCLVLCFPPHLEYQNSLHEDWKHLSMLVYSYYSKFEYWICQKVIYLYCRQFCFFFLIGVCVDSMHLWPPDFGLKYWIKKATSWKCSEIVCKFPTGELKKARKSPVGTAALHRRGCRRKLGGWCACFQCTAKVHYCKVQRCINVKCKSALMQSA